MEARRSAPSTSRSPSLPGMEEPTSGEADNQYDAQEVSGGCNTGRGAGGSTGALLGLALLALARRRTPLASGGHQRRRRAHPREHSTGCDLSVRPDLRRADARPARHVEHVRDAIVGRGGRTDRGKVVRHVVVAILRRSGAARDGGTRDGRSARVGRAGDDRGDRALAASWLPWQSVPSKLNVAGFTILSEAPEKLSASANGGYRYVSM